MHLPTVAACVLEYVSIQEMTQEDLHEVIRNINVFRIYPYEISVPISEPMPHMWWANNGTVAPTRSDRTGLTALMQEAHHFFPYGHVRVIISNSIITLTFRR